MNITTGSFAGIQPGQTLQLNGFWREHPQYGLQFQVTNYKETKPATITGIEKYLGSGLIKGVGPVTAKRIVAHFGIETLDIIENQIVGEASPSENRLHEVNGIARKRITMIKKAWETQKAIKEVMVFLQSHGVSTIYAVKIYKNYGDKSIGIVTTNPYQLATDIYGIGFLTADKIARNLGVPTDSEFRYRAGITHIINDASEDGHCYLPQPELIEEVSKCLKTDDHQPTDFTQLAQETMHVYEEYIRPKFPDAKTNPALWLTESGERISYKTMWRNLHVIAIEARKAGLNLPPSFGWHSLRKSFATNYMEKHPEKVWELMHKMGHMNLSTLHRYVKFNRDYFDRCTNRIVSEIMSNDIEKTISKNNYADCVESEEVAGC